MVGAAGGQNSQLYVNILTEGASAEVSQIYTAVVLNRPADDAEASQVFSNLLIMSDNEAEVSQLFVMIVARGRVDDPSIKAWTYTQDGHDFYVLRLGTNFPTLVYDNYSKQWSIYGSGQGDPWRAYTGRNWQGGRKLALPWSDVVVGDDSTGVLYFLSPDQDYDDDAIAGDETPRPFRRRVTGQIVVKPGYISAPCYGVQLFGSIGSGPETLNVNLEISDDRGFTYDDMGDITLDTSDYNARVNWLSLGSMVAPGRLFRITDDGALKRLDSLEMDD